MKLGLALLRIIIGGLFIGHGLQKLAGKFGGHGIEGTGQAFESLGLAPGKTHAVAAGAAETVGGTLIAVGGFTPLGASLLTGTMATAVQTVHRPKGPWATEGGYEYNLVLMASVFALTDAGPGAWSVDAARGRERWGSAWALAQLAAGLGGAAAAVTYGRRSAAASGPAEPAPAPAAEAAA
jgi:putative oxidoreductase